MNSDGFYLYAEYLVDGLTHTFLGYVNTVHWSPKARTLFINRGSIDSEDEIQEVSAYACFDYLERGDMTFVAPEYETPKKSLFERPTRPNI